MSSNLDIFDLCVNRIYRCYNNYILDDSLSEEDKATYYKAVIDCEFELKKLRYEFYKFLGENE